MGAETDRNVAEMEGVTSEINIDVFAVEDLYDNVPATVEVTDDMEVTIHAGTWSFHFDPVEATVAGRALIAGARECIEKAKADA